MSMDLNAASCSAGDSSYSSESLERSPVGQDVLGRLVDASTRIPGLTSVSSENLEVIEHLGTGRDIIVSGPDRLASVTCAALPAAAGYGLVVVVTHSMNSIKRMKARFESINVNTESFDLAPTKAEKRQIWDRMDRREIQILLVTPGRLSSQRFRDRLRRRDIAIIIVDQAQLMSPWSHKFLPNYRFVGNFLASLQSEHKRPQKIAIVWNPSARVTHDLTKLLSLNNPYQGRLTPEVIPGFGIDCLPASSDQDRLKIIEKELERSCGQGVIYCNSIKQLYDTTELLTRLGEEFSVIRPGIDDFTASKTRQQFESGNIRVVVSIGPVLSEIENTQGIEFVIFNGMTDSAETLAKEVFGVEDSGFVRAVVICGEKDYFQHRFSIDKNYPDALVMRACLQGVRDVFGSKSAVTLETLSSHVKMATPYPGDDVEQCLQVMFREGLLEKLVDQETGSQYVGCAVTAEEESNFWHEYPLRKIDHISRLDKMREFSAKEGDRARLLRSLIRA